MVVYNSNPAAIAPDQNAVLSGLRREDLFTVVLEQFQTDTADYADIVLPVTTFLEHTDLYLAYGHYHLQLARPALAAPGETKSNVEIFRLLAARMGFDDACFADTDDDMVRTLLDSPHPFLKDITLERLDREHSVRLNVAEDGAPFLPFAEGNFGTPDGKCHFNAETLDYQPPVESRHGDASLKRRYPLELISPKNDDSMNSTFGHRDSVDLATATLHLSAADAAARGIRACRPGARLQRPRRLPADGQRGWTGAPRRGLRACGALGQALIGQAQRQRADQRSNHRFRRRSYLLQLPCSSGEKRRLMTHTLLTERRAAVRLCCSLLLMALVLAPMACKRKKVRVGATDEETPKMQSVLNMGDTRVEPQLIKGFHGIEAAAWRWTEKQFTVALRPPFGASQKGAKLTVKLTVPPVTIEKLKSVALSATAGGSALPPETYTTPGDYVYVREIPASLLTGDSLRVDFQLDKAMPPSGADIRELGIIVLSIGLESK